MATLRVLLDQLVTPTDPQLAEASRELAAALIAGAPSGCEVEAVVPAGGAVEGLPGLARTHRAGLQRRELLAALQMGLATGIGGGMVHSPTLFAPLVRHDRVHDHDQTVVTVWDLRPWDAPDELPRAVVGWRKAMLKRAAKHADAVVVPSHAMSRRLVEIAPKLRDRIRVISGASADGFAVPVDDVGRRRDLGLPDGYVLLAGEALASDGLADAFAAVAASGTDAPVVVLDVPEGREPAVADLASAAGLPERRLHVRGALDLRDRAAVYGAALAFVSGLTRAAFPWRTVDALTLGVPVIAADSPVGRETIVDGGVLAEADSLGDALRDALGSTSTADRLAVMASDRGKAFSWGEAADKVWALHAEI